MKWLSVESIKQGVIAGVMFAVACALFVVFGGQLSAPIMILMAMSFLVVLAVRMRYASKADR